jgi:hypothetical protein
MLGLMPALVAGIHVLAALQQNEDVDGRDRSPGRFAPADGQDGGLVKRLNAMPR